MAIIATFLQVAGVFSASSLTQAWAQYADAGSSPFEPVVDWADWVPVANGPVVAGKGTERFRSVNQYDIGGGTVISTCVYYTDVTGVQAIAPGGSPSDLLDDLYAIGGTGAANQSVSAVRNTTPGATVTSTVDCFATINGQPVPSTGIVVGTAHAPGAGRSMVFTPSSSVGGTLWRLMDRSRATGCTATYFGRIPLTGANPSLTLDQSGATCATGGPTVVALGYGADSVVSQVQSTDYAAVSYGHMLTIDTADGPASYGFAGAGYKSIFLQGNIVRGDTTVNYDLFVDPPTTTRSAGSAAYSIGIQEDAEHVDAPSDDALSDNNTSTANPPVGNDEEGFSAPNFPPLYPGDTHTVTIPCRANGADPGHVRGWIDWNGNGVYDATESSDEVGCLGAPATATLSFVVPADVQAGASFIRLRSSSAADIPPTGLLPWGEVEDHAVTITAPSTAITATKTADKANLVAGETVGYTFTVRNDGNVVIPTVTITDPMLGLDQAACATNVAIGATVTCSTTGQHVVTQADVDAGQLVNNATINVTNKVNETTPNPVSATVAGTQSPSVALAKTGTLNDADGDGRADVGETITYSFVATNTGNVTLTGVTVTDPKVGLNGAECVGTLAPNQSAPCVTQATYTVTAADMATGSIDNAATATATSASGQQVSSPPTGADAGNASTPVDSDSALAMQKSGALADTDGDGRADVGETITYTFTVTNTGLAPVAPVTVSDPKLGITDLPCADSLAPGASATCTSAPYTVTEADLDAGAVSNSATATGTAPDGTTTTTPAAGEGAGVSSLPVDESPGVSLVKSGALNDADADGVADVGETITYTFTVTNTGSSILSPVTVSDPKLGLSNVACAPSLDRGASATCAAPDPYVVTQADVDAGSVSNVATATGTSPDGTSATSPTTGPGAGMASTPVDTTNAMTMVKTGALNDADGDAMADAGETITYTFAVTNTGSQTLTGVTVSDAKLGITDLACVDSLAPGASASCTSAPYTVTQADIDAGAVTNTATATGTAPGGAPVTSPTTGVGAGVASTPVDKTAGVTITKTGVLDDTDRDGLADAGETITYTFEVTNSGATTLTNVTVTDAKLGITDFACVDSLAPGASGSCTSAPYTVTVADIDAGGVRNSASASGTAPDGTRTSSDPAGGSATTPVDDQPSIALVKTGALNDANDNGVADAGETVDYTFVVTNTGATTFTLTSISDAKLGITDMPCSASLAPQESTTCTAADPYVVTQADVDSGGVTNSASATGTNPDGTTTTSPTSGAGSGGSVIPVNTTSGITMSKTGQLNDEDGDGAADVGETITYTFTVTNTGGTSLTPITVTDTKVGWTNEPCLPTLGGGQTANCANTATYTVTQADVDAGAVVNSASATGTAPDGSPVTSPSTGAGSGNASTPADSTAPSISMTKTGALDDADGDALADAGETITYTFAVTNQGTKTLAPVTVSDTKLGVTDLVCADSLAPGATATCTASPYTVTQADIDAGAVTNSASATGTAPDGKAVSTPSTGAGAGEATTPVDSRPGISMVKAGALNDRDGDNAADVGETITYTFTVTNSGTSTLSPVTVSDAKLGVTDLVCADSLPSGASATCAAPPYTVTQADVDSGSVQNAASATGTAPGGSTVTTPSSGPGSGNASTPADSTAPAISMVKSGQLNDADGDGLADAGETITYTFAVTNEGTKTLAPVTVSDPKLGISNLVCADSLAPGAIATCAAPTSYTVTADDVNSGGVANSASATGTAPDGTLVATPESGPGSGGAVTPADSAFGNPVVPPSVTGMAASGQPAVLPVDLAPGMDQSSLAFPTAGQPAGSSVSPDGKTLTVPGEGVWTTTPDGSLVFTPEAGFIGDPTPVLFTADDFAGNTSAPGTASVEYPQVPADATGMAASGQPATVDVVLDEGMDPASVQFPTEGQPADSSVSPDGKTLTVPGEGVWTTTPEGDIVFTPEAGFTGDPTPVKFTASDTQGNLAPAGQASVEYPQVPGDATGAGPAGQPVTVDVVLDEGMDPASVQFPTEGQPAGSSVSPDGKTLTVPGEGVWTTTPEGDIVFTPEAGFTGDPTPVAYTAADTQGNLAPVGKASVDYPQVPPSVTGMAASGQPATMPVTLDESMDPASLAFPTEGQPDGATVSPDGKTLTVPGEGVWTTTPEGDIVFTPDAGFIGDPTPVLFTAKDDAGNTSLPGTASVEYPQVPGDATGAGPAGQPVTVDVVLDEGMDPASVQFPTAGQPEGSTVSPDGKTLTVPGEGVWTTTPEGDIVFTPEAGFTGDPTPVAYTAADTQGNLAPVGKASVDYPQVPPSVTGMAASGQPATMPVTLDESMDPASLAFPTEGQPDGATVSPDGKTLTVPGEGVWTTTPDGSLVFTPEAGFTGDPTPVKFTAKDDAGNTSLPGTASVEYPQVPGDASGAGAPGQPVTIDVVLDEGMDPASVQFPTTGQPAGSSVSTDGKTLTVPGEGVWTTTPEGDIVFTPEAGFTGDPTPVAYTAADTEGNLAPVGKASVDYPQVPPSVTGMAATGAPATMKVTLPESMDPASLAFPTTGQPAGSSVSPDGKTLTVPGEGTWTTTPDGSLVFTPEAGFTGDPTPVKFTAKDDAGNTSLPGTASVEYPQVPGDATGSGAPGQPATIDLALDNGMDPTSVQFPTAGQPAGSTVSPDGKTLTVPGEGVWTTTPEGDIVFTPEAGFTGDPTPIAYTAADTLGNLAPVGKASATYPSVPGESVGTGQPGQPAVIDVQLDSSMDPASVRFIADGAPTGSTLSPDGKTLTVPGEGVWTIDANGDITFTPEAGFEGDPTPVTYVAEDADGNVSAPGTAGVDYPQDPAIALVKTAVLQDRDGDALADVGEVVTYTFTITNTGNTTLTQLQVTDTKVAATPLACGDPATGLAPGASRTCPTVDYTVVRADIAAGGVLNTATSSGYSSALDRYTTSNGAAGVNVGPVTVVSNADSAVIPVDSQASTVPSASGTGKPGEPAVVDLNLGDEFDASSVVFTDAKGLPAGAVLSEDGKTLTVPGEGVWTIDPLTGDITFTPEAGFDGDPSPVWATVTDRNGNVSEPFEISLNYPQVGAIDDVVFTPGQPVTVRPVLDDGMDASTVIFPAAGQPTGAVISDGGKTMVIPGEGTWRVSADGSITFTPEPGFAGDPSPILYTAADADGNFATPKVIDLDGPTATSPAPTTTPKAPAPAPKPTGKPPVKKIPIAYTGSPLTTLGIGGLLLLVVGGTLIAVRRRRSQPE